MQQKKKPNHMLLMVYFGITMVYLEIIFRAFTVGGIWNMGFFYTLAFVVAYSTIGYLLSTIFKKRKINRIIASVLIAGTTIVYIVQFLIYKQFKQFYDINTMTGGAGDALTSYFAELMHLIFIQGGIFVILLMALPFVIYLLLGKHWIPAFMSTARVRLKTVIVAASIYFITLLLVLVHPVYEPIYSDQYNFQAAVSDLGLLTGLRLDIQHSLFDYGSSFDQTLNEFGLVASATRMSDKFNRFKSLMRYGSTARVEDEKIEDTLMDLAAYAIMTVEWIKKNQK